MEERTYYYSKIITAILILDAYTECGKTIPLPDDVRTKLKDTQCVFKFQDTRIIAVVKESK